MRRLIIGRSTTVGVSLFSKRKSNLTLHQRCTTLRTAHAKYKENLIKRKFYKTIKDKHKYPVRTLIHQYSITKEDLDNTPYLDHIVEELHKLHGTR
jgi:hypothetical protein